MNDRIRQICEENRRSWCILRHPDSWKIARIFRGEFGLDTDDDHPQPPFDFFILADDIDPKILKSFDDGAHEYAEYDPLLDATALRRDLSRFIFICLDRYQTEAMLQAPWARALKYRMGVYRDRDGHPTEISGAAVLELSRMVCQQSFFYAIRQPGTAYEEIHDGEKVVVVNGPMVGKVGEVTGMSEQDGQLLLTLRIEIFDNRLPLDIPGFSIFDVRHCDDGSGNGGADAAAAPGDDAEGSLIASFENRIIGYLSHLHGRKGSRQRNQADHGQLRAILRYANVRFSEAGQQARFKALMLLCAYLLNDKPHVAQRQREVEQLLEGRTAPASHLDCYLMTALFIVTHQPELRRQVKLWRQAHPDCPVSIRRFHSIAKLIHC